MPASATARHILATPTAGEHIAQLYVNSEELVHAVGVFAAGGLARGDSVVLVVAAAHEVKLRQRLAALSVEVARHLERRRLVFADAAATLAAVSTRGQPDGARFRRHVGGLLRRAAMHSQTGQVCAFGEMVEILRVAGSDAGALRLETLWNELLAAQPVTLLCGYRASPKHFPRDLATTHDRVFRAPSSRERMMQAGRELFSAAGFDDTTTAAIARRASTSESQLIKHFGHKKGLLEAIFDDWWQRVHSDIERVASSGAPPAERLLRVGDTVLDALARDHEVARLLLLEGRRLRGGQRRPGGLRRFLDIVDEILVELVPRRPTARGLPARALRAALMGAVEGLIRDRLTLRKGADATAYGLDEIRSAFHTLAGSFLHLARAQAEDLRHPGFSGGRPLGRRRPAARSTPLG